MPTESLFTPLANAQSWVTIDYEGHQLRVPQGVSIAAALLASGVRHSRTTPVQGANRAPFCMMGVCFECLVEVDGVPNRQGCMTLVSDGLRVRRQLGARKLAPLCAEGDCDEN
ncbi:hypothetical protein AX279_18855 [Pseudomonas sp. J237]|nr:MULTISPECIES: (2Fe-2S)-binding protein [Pseudomonas]OEO23908.1 hypothetical protein AX279_18855 [Pseudomonas sp. J237]